MGPLRASYGLLGDRVSKYLTIRRVDGGVIVHNGEEHVFTSGFDLASFCANWFEPDEENLLRKTLEKYDNEGKYTDNARTYKHLVYCDKCGKIAYERYSLEDGIKDEVCSEFYCLYCDRIVV